MAEAKAGVVGTVELDGGSSKNTALDNAATWTVIWFGIAALFLLCLYFGLGGFRGSVAS